MQKIATLLTIGLLGALLSNAPAATIVNVDFNGVQGSEPAPQTASIQGAAGGGTVFNGVLVDSRGGNYALNINTLALADSFGVATTVQFAINNVGGDNNPGADTPTDLYGDYLYNNDVAYGGNNYAPGGSPFTISGLGNASTADIYFYVPSFQPNPNMVFGSDSGVYGTYNGLLARYYQSVAVTNGSISGSFGDNTGIFNIMSGFSIAYVQQAVPEPSTYALMSLGLVGLLAFRRFRNLGKA